MSNRLEQLRREFNGGKPLKLKFVKDRPRVETTLRRRDGTLQRALEEARRVRMEERETIERIRREERERQEWERMHREWQNAGDRDEERYRIWREMRRRDNERKYYT